MITSPDLNCSWASITKRANRSLSFSLPLFLSSPLSPFLYLLLVVCKQGRPCRDSWSIRRRSSRYTHDKTDMMPRGKKTLGGTLHYEVHVSMPEAVCYFKEDLERIPDSPDYLLVYITLSHQHDYLTTSRPILAFKPRPPYSINISAYR